MRSKSCLFFFIAALFLLIGSSNSAQGALLDVNSILELPLIGYDGGGTLNYNASSDILSINATPNDLLTPSLDEFSFTNSRTLTINVKIDGTGELIAGGVPGQDLVVTGDVDLTPAGFGSYSGELLTGEVLEFGFQEAGSTDRFDFRFILTGGLLSFLYADMDMGVDVTSESSTFHGNFVSGFAGGAKGNLGAIQPLPEPAGMLLLFTGLLAFAGFRKRFRK